MARCKKCVLVLFSLKTGAFIFFLFLLTKLLIILYPIFYYRYRHQNKYNSLKGVYYYHQRSDNTTARMF